MTRITSTKLHQLAKNVGIGLASDANLIYVQHSVTGWHIFQTVGSGGRAIAECLTATECAHYLQGMMIGSILKFDALNNENRIK